MKKQFVIGIILILLSTPLGYMSLNLLYANQNLGAGELKPILNGFIYSYMISGILIFSLGIFNKMKN
ncbi:glycosyl transferase [Niallia circulans]|uniref:Glycosyl transferase n=1 Tax=Niallia circulans TaxID=1397 RepID=A0A553SS69_NIACI|nr:glycosyl transferase [Niallia circulans]TRZ39826.1 glycosyl transferase [Niallia circulans]